MAFWNGLPDVGLLPRTDVVQHRARVAAAVDIPVYCDADTGFGPGPALVQRTVQEFIGAGVAGIHIEDQAEPKKAGGQSGIALVSDAEAIGRLAETPGPAYVIESADQRSRPSLAELSAMGRKRSR
ncbi:isocitrate lyase/phosphoenolpyruvate mutase family protein [Gordonia sp. KTR9]|uniref:isocitrate lyase/phosphoenolpyruvate mutase family protein n=1 Tax=Gordonia sp. KTR9 TaxID=337191 RepID=UPI00130D9F6C|nr:isocitrate lyase/phosphoenolpyruvate mutase family protein [Gordonia sp. KTR9]